ncbi:lipocalin family protein [uncultured Rikenella sp.]|uniref:lipocalin family protein n=1 Tax=uncultured Rikenella sp. TaxID=368003 RepID=UPI00261D646B|nr:lipocalin family protein [uncultured Rikenella sp.]
MEYDPIQNFDLKKYLGKWYEIARFDFRFERDMHSVTAEYMMRPDGKVRVVNSGRKEKPGSRLSVAEGKAKLGAPDDPTRPGFLKVSFFGPFYSPYYILALDPDYRYALVGGKKRKYLWILSRTPKLPQKTIRQLIDRADQLGFDTSKLVFTRQSE